MKKTSVKTKRITRRITAFVLAGALLAGLTACSFTDDLAKEYEKAAAELTRAAAENTDKNPGNDKSSDAQETQNSEANGADSGTGKNNTSDVLRFQDPIDPAETFESDIAREAAEIIDPSIKAAIKALNEFDLSGFSKDAVTTTEKTGFTRVSNRYDELGSSEKKLFDKAYTAFSTWSDLEIKESDYGKNLIIDALSASSAISQYCPYEACYADLDVLGKDVKALYFDPDLDQNTRVYPGTEEFEAVKEKMKVFDAVIDRVVKMMPENASTFEKYLYLSYVIADRCEYDRDGACRNRYTAYGTLVGGCAVCEGYSAALSILCEKADLSCEFVSGLIYDEGHRWNLVTLGGETYYIDITNCDRVYDLADNGVFTYFMLSDDELENEDFIVREGNRATGNSIR